MVAEHRGFAGRQLHHHLWCQEVHPAGAWNSLILAEQAAHRGKPSQVPLCGQKSL